MDNRTNIILIENIEYWIDLIRVELGHIYVSAPHGARIAQNLNAINKELQVLKLRERLRQMKKKP